MFSDHTARRREQRDLLEGISLGKELFARFLKLYQWNDFSKHPLQISWSCSVSWSTSVVGLPKYVQTGTRRFY